MKKRLIIKLDGGNPDGSIRVMCDRINLAEGRSRSVETLARVFKYPNDHFYGELEIDRKMLSQMVRNFDAGTYGQKIYVNIAHMDHQGAAGEIVRIFQEGAKLRGEIEWNDHGLEAIHKRGFRYFSAEFVEDYQDPETEKRHGAALLGAAITIRPRVKHLDPIDPEKLMLSEDTGDHPVVVLPNVRKMLSEEITKMWEQLRRKLEEQLKKLGLDAGPVKTLSDSFIATVENITDEAAATKLQESFVAAGKQLHEKMQATPGQPISINITGPNDAKLLTEEQVQVMIKKAKEDESAAAKKLQEDLGKNVKLFTDKIDAAEGLKVLSEDEKTEMKQSGSELITASMTEDQINKLADHHIAMGNKLAVSQQLAQRGYSNPGATGHIHITMDESNTIKGLQEEIDKRLGYKEMADSQRFARHGGQLPDRVKKLTEESLRMFDHHRGRRLQQEAKMLAGGDGDVGDADVPAIFERTVIREALYRLTALNFVDVGTHPFAQTVNIPFSYRDTSGAGKSNARKYEGQAISRAGVIQTSENAYTIPQKIAFLVSDELRYLTQASIYNWDAVAENTRNSIRIVGEDTEQVIMNEIIHATLEYGAVAVENEDLEPQADGTDEVFLLANFPVVRPRKVYDLQGNQVGNTINPVTVSYDGTPALEYDGTGTQDAGIYYVLDYDLGEIYLVNQAGVVQVPADTDVYTISYSYATNVYAFDTDLPSGIAVDKHWNTFLYRYGLRKALINDQRFHSADLGVMSTTFMTAIEQADTFAANFRRMGTDLTADGDLGRIKGIPNFSTTAPGLHIGDRYAIIGERNTTRFRMLKPWMMGELENARDTNGNFIGKKEAYGDQFIICHTPSQLKRATTAILQYSADARVARVIS